MKVLKELWLKKLPLCGGDITMSQTETDRGKGDEVGGGYGLSVKAG